MKLIRTAGRITLLIAAWLFIGVAHARAGGEAVIAAATGGAAISADTAGTTWTTLTGPIITETYARDVGAFSLGTIVLTIPEGFEFDTVEPVSVLLYAAGHKTINRLPNYAILTPQVTATTITLEITATSRGGIAWPDTLEFQNIRVRPTAGYPLASGHITQSGTCQLRNPLLISGTWGFLRTVGGTLAGYKITGPTELTAGSEALITIQKVDQYGNPLPDGTPAQLTFSGLGTVGAYAPTIAGSANAFTTGIEVAFDSTGSATLPLVAYLAESAVLNVSNGSVSSADIQGGLPVTVSPGPASGLAPIASATTVVYGNSFSVEVQIQDAFGNPVGSGSGPGPDISLAVTSGPGTLLSDAAQPIPAPGGSIIFDGLQLSAAGPNQILTASAPGLNPGFIAINISQAVVIPAVTVADKTYDGTTAAAITGRSLDGVHPGNEVTLGTSGAAAFDTKDVGTGKTVTVGGLVLTGPAAGNYALSTDTVSVTAAIMPAGSTTALVASSNPVLQGSPLTLTATVSPADDADEAALVGTVQFLSDGQPLGAPVTLVNGRASFTTAALAYGSYTITATYSGSADFLNSAATLVVVVDVETPRIISIVNNGDGTATITAQGQPGMLYLVQATTNLNPPIDWVNVSTNTAGLTDGIWQYVGDMTQYPQRFFRAAKP